MEFKIEHRAVLEHKTEIAAVWELLKECNSEFVPPLSARNSTIDQDLKVSSEDSEPTAYFQKLLGQEFLLAKTLNHGNVVGFMSFISNYDHEYLKNYLPNHYISTLCVFKKYRGKNIANQLYDYLENEFSTDFIATRTWDSNHSHIPLLQKRQYTEVARVLNDRGKGIDTLFFALQRK